MANLTSTDGKPAIRGRIQCKRNDAELIINARVSIDPMMLRREIEDCLAASAAACGVQAWVERIESLKPGRPKPRHQFDSVA